MTETTRSSVISGEGSGCSNGCNDDTKAFETIQPGQSVTHDHRYLQPIIHETITQHEVEEVTKMIERERHLHFVHLHVLPIHRPRKIVTRVRLVVETEIMPEEESNLTGTSTDTTEDITRQLDAITLHSKHKEEGQDMICHYQQYAQITHDRAVALIAERINAAMTEFESELPIVSEEERNHMKRAKERNEALLSGSIF